MDRERIRQAWATDDLETLKELAFWEMQKCPHGHLEMYGPLPQGRAVPSNGAGCWNCRAAREREVCAHKKMRSWSAGGIAGDNYMCPCSKNFKEQYVADPQSN